MKSTAFKIDPEEFSGKRILVTGGTKGAGRAIFERLEKAGANILTTARSIPDDMDPSQIIQADISTKTGTDKVIEETLKRMNGLDILINNAGGSSSPTGGALALEEQDWENELNINLLASVRLDKGFLPSMITQKDGVIIHISSIQRVFPLYDSTLGYAAAKAALSVYSKGLSNEMASKGIRVNTVAPGGIKTTAADNMVIQIAKSRNISIEEAWKILYDSLGGVPMGRFAEPEEIAELVAFLASPRAAYLTGNEYIIDGGTVPTI